MDYHTMKRKELQELCKKNGIPANLTNREMADRLSSIDKENKKLVSQKEPLLNNTSKKVSENDTKVPKKAGSSLEKPTIVPEVPKYTRASRRLSVAPNEQVPSIENDFSLPPAFGRMRSKRDLKTDTVEQENKKLVSQEEPLPKYPSKKTGDNDSKVAKKAGRSLEKQTIVSEVPAYTRASRRLSMAANEQVQAIENEVPLPPPAGRKRSKRDVKNDTVEQENKKLVSQVEPLLNVPSKKASENDSKGAKNASSSLEKQTIDSMVPVYTRASRRLSMAANEQVQAIENEISLPPFGRKRLKRDVKNDTVEVKNALESAENENVLVGIAAAPQKRRGRSETLVDGAEPHKVLRGSQRIVTKDDGLKVEVTNRTTRSKAKIVGEGSTSQNEPEEETVQPEDISQGLGKYSSEQKSVVCQKGKVVKKVRFSPDDQTFIYEVSGNARGGSRRSLMKPLSKKQIQTIESELSSPPPVGRKRARRDVKNDTVEVKSVVASDGDLVTENSNGDLMVSRKNVTRRGSKKTINEEPGFDVTVEEDAKIGEISKTGGRITRSSAQFEDKASEDEEVQGVCEKVFDLEEPMKNKDRNALIGKSAADKKGKLGSEIHVVDGAEPNKVLRHGQRNVTKDKGSEMVGGSSRNTEVVVRITRTRAKILGKTSAAQSQPEEETVELEVPSKDLSKRASRQNPVVGMKGNMVGNDVHQDKKVTRKRSRTADLEGRASELKASAEPCKEFEVADLVEPLGISDKAVVKKQLGSTIMPIIAEESPSLEHLSAPEASMNTDNLDASYSKQLESSNKKRKSSRGESGTKKQPGSVEVFTVNADIEEMKDASKSVVNEECNLVGQDKLQLVVDNIPEGITDDKSLNSLANFGHSNPAEQEVVDMISSEISSPAVGLHPANQLQDSDENLNLLESEKALEAEKPIIGKSVNIGGDTADEHLEKDNRVSVQEYRNSLHLEDGKETPDEPVIQEAILVDHLNELYERSSEKTCEISDEKFEEKSLIDTSVGRKISPSEDFAEAIEMQEMSVESPGRSALKSEGIVCLSNKVNNPVDQEVLEIEKEVTNKISSEITAPVVSFQSANQSENLAIAGFISKVNYLAEQEAVEMKNEVSSMFSSEITSPAVGFHPAVQSEDSAIAGFDSKVNNPVEQDAVDVKNEVRNVISSEITSPGFGFHPAIHSEDPAIAGFDSKVNNSVEQELVEMKNELSNIVSSEFTSSAVDFHPAIQSEDSAENLNTLELEKAHEEKEPSIVEIIYNRSDNANEHSNTDDIISVQEYQNIVQVEDSKEIPAEPVIQEAVLADHLNLHSESSLEKDSETPPDKLEDSSLTGPSVGRRISLTKDFTEPIEMQEITSETHIVSSECGGDTVETTPCRSPLESEGFDNKLNNSHLNTLLSSDDREEVTPLVNVTAGSSFREAISKDSEVSDEKAVEVINKPAEYTEQVGSLKSEECKSEDRNSSAVVVDFGSSAKFFAHTSSDEPEMCSSNAMVPPLSVSHSLGDYATNIDFPFKRDDKDKKKTSLRDNEGYEGLYDAVQDQNIVDNACTAQKQSDADNCASIENDISLGDNSFVSAERSLLIEAAATTGLNVADFNEPKESENIAADPMIFSCRESAEVLTGMEAPITASEKIDMLKEIASGGTSPPVTPERQCADGKSPMDTSLEITSDSLHRIFSSGSGWEQKIFSEMKFSSDALSEKSEFTSSSTLSRPNNPSGTVLEAQFITQDFDDAVEVKEKIMNNEQVDHSVKDKQICDEQDHQSHPVVSDEESNGFDSCNPQRVDCEVHNDEYDVGVAKVLMVEAAATTGINIVDLDKSNAGYCSDDSEEENDTAAPRILDVYDSSGLVLEREGQIAASEKENTQGEIRSGGTSLPVTPICADSKNPKETSNEITGTILQRMFSGGSGWQEIDISENSTAAHGCLDVCDSIGLKTDGEGQTADPEKVNMQEEIGSAGTSVPVTPIFADSKKPKETSNEITGTILQRMFSSGSGWEENDISGNSTAAHGILDVRESRGLATDREDQTTASEKENMQEEIGSEGTSLPVTPIFADSKNPEETSNEITGTILQQMFSSGSGWEENDISENSTAARGISDVCESRGPATDREDQTEASEKENMQEIGGAGTSLPVTPIFADSKNPNETSNEITGTILQRMFSGGSGWEENDISENSTAVHGISDVCESRALVTEREDQTAASEKENIQEEIGSAGTSLPVTPICSDSKNLKGTSYEVTGTTLHHMLSSGSGCEEKGISESKLFPDFFSEKFEFSSSPNVSCTNDPASCKEMKEGTHCLAVNQLSYGSDVKKNVFVPEEADALIPETAAHCSAVSPVNASSSAKSSMCCKEEMKEGTYCLAVNQLSYGSDVKKNVFDLEEADALIPETAAHCSAVSPVNASSSAKSSMCCKGSGEEDEIENLDSGVLDTNCEQVIEEKMREKLICNGNLTSQCCEDSNSAAAEGTVAGGVFHGKLITEDCVVAEFNDAITTNEQDHSDEQYQLKDKQPCEQEHHTHLAVLDDLSNEVKAFSAFNQDDIDCENHRDEDDGCAERLTSITSAVITGSNIADFIEFNDEDDSDHSKKTKNIAPPPGILDCSESREVSTDKEVLTAAFEIGGTSLPVTPIGPCTGSENAKERHSEVTATTLHRLFAGGSVWEENNNSEINLFSFPSSEKSESTATPTVFPNDPAYCKDITEEVPNSDVSLKQIVDGDKAGDSNDEMDTENLNFASSSMPEMVGDCSDVSPVSSPSSYESKALELNFEGDELENSDGGVLNTNFTSENAVKVEENVMIVEQVSPHANEEQHHEHEMTEDLAELNTLLSDLDNLTCEGGEGTNLAASEENVPMIEQEDPQLTEEQLCEDEMSNNENKDLELNVESNIFTSYEMNLFTAPKGNELENSDADASNTNLISVNAVEVKENEMMIQQVSSHVTEEQHTEHVTAEEFEGLDSLLSYLDKPTREGVECTNSAAVGENVMMTEREGLQVTEQLVRENEMVELSNLSDFDKPTCEAGEVTNSAAGGDIADEDAWGLELKLLSPQMKSPEDRSDGSNALFAKKLDSSMLKQNKRSTVIPSTPKQPIHDMKENAMSTKREKLGSITAHKGMSKRRALEDLSKK